MTPEEKEDISMLLDSIEDMVAEIRDIIGYGCEEENEE